MLKKILGQLLHCFWHPLVNFSPSSPLVPSSFEDHVTPVHSSIRLMSWFLQMNEDMCTGLCVWLYSLTIMLLQNDRVSFFLEMNSTSRCKYIHSSPEGYLGLFHNSVKIFLVQRHFIIIPFLFINGLKRNVGDNHYKVY